MVDGGVCAWWRKTQASIEARKPDFDAYIDPQKKEADVVVQVLPTQLIPDDNEGKVLRVRLIQKEGVKNFEPTYLFDEGSTISWIPCGRKLTCSYPGIKFFYGPDTYYGDEVSVLEMDGQFDKLEVRIIHNIHNPRTHILTLIVGIVSARAQVVDAPKGEPITRDTAPKLT